MPDASEVPPLKASTVSGLIARLGGQLSAIEGKQNPDATTKARKLIVPLMAILNSIVGQVEEGDLDRWVEDLAPRFKEVTAHVKATPGDAVGEPGGCYYRRGGTTELFCIRITKDACDGLGTFDPNGCPPS
ncbi:hypothetical protein J0H58_22870 [bacterium]|nr:hypothetical protein [bacterium]